LLAFGTLFADATSENVAEAMRVVPVAFGRVKGMWGFVQI
jgi:hypothetical protein